MSATSSLKTSAAWVEEPRRTGFAWVSGNLRRLAVQISVCLLSRFVSLLGAVSTPGMRPVGILQAWALRRMGVQVASNEIWIGPKVYFDYPRNVAFGRRVVIGADSRITARDPVVFGDDFLSAPGLYVNTGSHDLATLTPESRPITIGPGVWCGLRVTICSGVTIGAGAVIGAASLVISDVPPRCVALGVPCKPRRDIAELRAGAGRPWSNFRGSS